MIWKKAYKPLSAMILVVVLLLELSACGKANLPAASEPTDTEATAATTCAVEITEEELWKVALAEDLFNKYGVLPEYYENLGDGRYAVYVEVGGEVMRFGTVDAQTQDFIME